MRKQPPNAQVVFSAQHVAQALQKVATLPGNYHRPYLYTTPSGTFVSLTQVAAVYSITPMWAKARFKNFNLPEWTVDRA